MLEILICPYCNEPSKYVDSREVYGRSYGMIYLCRPCDAYVGVHKGTDKPLGRLANKQLREWKKMAHAAFDPLWKAKFIRRRAENPEYKKHYARGSGYKWLAGQLGIDGKDCHIGMFDVDMCRRVVNLINNKEWKNIN